MGGHGRALEEPESAPTPVSGASLPSRLSPPPAQLAKVEGFVARGSSDKLVTRRQRGPCPRKSTKEKHYVEIVLFSNNDNMAGMAS